MAGLFSRLQYSRRFAHCWICRRWSVIFVSRREEQTRCGNILDSYVILVKWSSVIIAPLVFETAWIKHGNLHSCSRLHYVRYWILFRNFYKFVYFTWSDNKVRDLIAVKVLHTSLLNATVVAFKVLPLGSYAPMPAPSPPFKSILELVLWNGLQSSR